MRANTDWFMKARWGLFCHYLGPAPHDDGSERLSADDWSRQVDAVDVTALAGQVEAAGARYLVLTIGQNSGHFCAPNQTYDELVGIRPSKCSRRDLVSDVQTALAARGIDLLVYLPAGAPAADRVAMARLEWEWGFTGGWPQAWGTQRTGNRLVAFQQRWEAIIREWSLRWGRRVRGWWIDGCYFADEMYRHPDAPNFASFAAALKAGNPDRLVAFNPGVMVPVVCHSEDEDYTAGEIARAFPECPGRWVNGAQYHILSFLGSDWCRGEQPRFPDPFIVGYTRHVNDHEGVVTWDVPISPAGRIPEPFIRQLRSLGSG